ncbi:hypothetical protein NIES4071_77280 [Calothrix sp. NIES-4071]|nr:hypothetical protein NIES4071_77280 [Calothrix sp. NIES-4071]BAZ62001.1 hypothetical protein NIES4105_77220 [Calothrix sp. NIES-4105]
MLEINQVHNPYDFSNPVSKLELFAGRKTELEDIIYYLNHAVKAPKPINIALLGKRASGKTSFLNIINEEAKKLGFCAVRVDLDEGDTQTQLQFFSKLFNSILLEACELGAFAGIHGKTYETHQDIMFTYTIPDDKTFSPFLFPLQYARAMNGGNHNIQIDDNVFKRDLITIQTELDKPIIVLFDECNVLSNSRVILEKIRNIFMNICGYMLVFTGTPELFPIIDDIFSPIIRQFKKINIVDFKKINDTHDCILKPLKEVGIDIEHVLDLETNEDIQEIHDLSGGRPYEIQLICHIMFRRLQNKRAKKMKLDLSILEDVRRELETSQTLSNRPILSKILNLTHTELSALKIFSIGNGKVTFEQAWAIEYIFNENTNWTKDILQELLNKFIREQIFTIEGDIIKFSGDDFDKIYTKYYAREQSIPLSFLDFPIDVIFVIHALSKFRITDLDNITIISTNSSVEESDIYNLTQQLASDDLKYDVFVESPHMVKDLYFLMVEHRKNDKLQLLNIRFILPWLTIQLWLGSKENSCETIINSFPFSIEQMKERISIISGELILKTHDLAVAPVNSLIKKLVSTANEEVKKSIAYQHFRNAYDIYVSSKNFEEVAFHINLAFAISTEIEDWMVNACYLLIVTEDYMPENVSTAKSVLEQLATSDILKENQPLINYNLGILYLKEDNPEQALNKFDSCIEYLKNSESPYPCSHLLIVDVQDDKLVIREQENVNLFDIARTSKLVLEAFLK